MITQLANTKLKLRVSGCSNSFQKQIVGKQTRRVSTWMTARQRSRSRHQSLDRSCVDREA
jgi:hypothetical protein